jgi:hypothetical protein
MKWFLDTYLLGARTLRDKYPVLYYSWLSIMVGVVVGIIIVTVWKF